MKIQRQLRWSTLLMASALASGCAPGSYDESPLDDQDGFPVDADDVETRSHSNAPPTSGVCGRWDSGIYCGVSTGTIGGTSFTQKTQWSSNYRDAYGWDSDPSYWGTIQFPDVNGDGHDDVCGRGAGGIVCALSNGGAAFGAATTWTSDFSNAQYWDSAPSHWATIQFPDLDGDGDADICGRTSSGITCALSNGKQGQSSFAPAQTWISGFFANWTTPGVLDSGGWTLPSKWGTIQFADIDGDGSADVCGRGEYGVHCARSNGTAFVDRTQWSAAFGWSPPSWKWETIQLADVDGDNKADLCAHDVGIICYRSSGAGFNKGAIVASTIFTAAEGWNVSKDRWATIQFPDVNGDDRADVCGRHPDLGIQCALSQSTAFGPLSTWTDNFKNNHGWHTSPSYWATIQFPDIDTDGSADICGRSTGGIVCALSNDTSFGALTRWSAGTDFGNSEGWANGPEYWSTIQFPALDVGKPLPGVRLRPTPRLRFVQKFTCGVDLDCPSYL